ncbi:MAG: 2-hydroxy-3-oxopropionate reductase [Clostridia bacterium]|nr:2-hydroxy-3-oxopropionate reductase [Clostridia bacterium]MBN2882019.1 2-hydroxy-3-oxopropionate reductase [Clostridia bacterium]
MNKKIGFIGLGIMGKPMCRNLLKAGYVLYVYDIVQASVDEITASGANACASISEVAENCNIIITMLPNSPQVKEVVMGKGGIIENASKGTLVVDMSSIAPLASKECEAALKEAGMRMIDAPVSGGEPKAIEGTLSIMCGGEQSDFDEAKPLFEVMGGSSVLTGAIGSGNMTKLANQIIVAVNIAAMGEALTLAVKAGVDPELVFNAIRGGLAGSTVLEAKVPMVLDRNFKPGFKIDLHIKDLKNVVETANELKSPIFLTTQVLQMMQVLSGEGEGGNDHGGIARFYEKLAGIEIC